MGAIGKDENPFTGEIGGIHRLGIPGHPQPFRWRWRRLQPQQVAEFLAEFLNGANADRHRAHRGHAELAFQPGASGFSQFGVEAEVGVCLRDSLQISGAGAEGGHHMAVDV